MKGLRWGIGNGVNVSIWKDKWLPTPSTYKVMSPVKDLNENVCVCSLIDAYTSRWKEDVIDGIFVDHEAKVIKSIPLNPCGGADDLIWLGSPKGIFFIRSAYALALEDASWLSAGSGESSNAKSEETFWKNLWKLNLCPKIKVFGWCICRNLLPTRSNLSNRGMVIETLCPLCRHPMETMLHCFRDCKTAGKFWDKGSLLLGVDGSEGLISFQDALLVGNLEAASSLLIGFWCLWLNRNSCMMEDVIKDADAILRFAMTLKEDWSKK